MCKTVKRGFINTDIAEFNNENLKKLYKAQADIFMLINRGYAIDKAVEFVSNHYMISARQRLALKRATSTIDDINSRKLRLKTSLSENRTINIDGLNAIITLEVALSGSTLLKCMDNTIRDLAGLRGTYRIIDKTETAIKLIFDELKKLNPEKIVFYLDSPVSNTGKLKTKILEIEMPFDVEVYLVPNADVILEKLENVVTSDGIILNKCKSWFNTCYNIIKNLPSQNIIDLSNPLI